MLHSPFASSLARQPQPPQAEAQLSPSPESSGFLPHQPARDLDLDSCGLVEQHSMPTMCTDSTTSPFSCRDDHDAQSSVLLPRSMPADAPMNHEEEYSSNQAPTYKQTSPSYRPQLHTDISHPSLHGSRLTSSPCDDMHSHMLSHMPEGLQRPACPGPPMHVTNSLSAKYAQLQTGYENGGNELLEVIKHAQKCMAAAVQAVNAAATAMDATMAASAERGALQAEPPRNQAGSRSFLVAATMTLSAVMS